MFVITENIMKRPVQYCSKFWTAQRSIFKILLSILFWQFVYKEFHLST